MQPCLARPFAKKAKPGKNRDMACTGEDLMNQIMMKINGQELKVQEETTILQAARQAGIYIPVLCAHPDLPGNESIEPVDYIYQGEQKIENTQTDKTAAPVCGICLVEVQGASELLPSCTTKVQPGMVVTTENERITLARQKNLSEILADHPHSCLTCAQQDGCSRTQCTFNIPENERCCDLFGLCELQKVANYIGISRETPRWVPTDLPILDSSLFLRNYNLCLGCLRCVRVCCEVRGVGAIGFVYDLNGKIQVGTIQSSLEESGCRFCTACVHVCPTGAIQDNSAPRLIKEESIVPCRAACPANINIPEYLRLIAQGKNDQANTVIREKVPFPRILGRVCSHPCEDACRRRELNEAISICALKRYAADREQGTWRQKQIVKNNTGKKIAIIGAGPAGMTAAFYLKKLGHKVNVFEVEAKAGGMMRYGIPSFRLPVEVIDQELQEIFDLGVDFYPNTRLGQDIYLEQLRNDGFDAVFLAVGAKLSRKITLTGSNHPDILWGIEFLRQVSLGKKDKLKKKVVIVGGGNVAVDTAMTVLRCRRTEVTIVCLERKKEMPVNQWVIDIALEEGIFLKPSWGVNRILIENERITGLELRECTSVFDRYGLFSPSFSETTTTIEANQIIFAIGQAPDLFFIDQGHQLKIQKGLIVVDENNLQTNIASVYAGGDAATIDNGTIIQAITSGRKAASAIDNSLGGQGDIEENLFSGQKPAEYLGREEGFAYQSRQKEPRIDLSQRKGFQELSLGFSEEQALKEARRCLQCDLRLFLQQNPLPPKLIETFSPEKIQEVPETEGVYQLYDGNNCVISIKGCHDMRKGLMEAFNSTKGALYFDYEESRMFSQRETELIQKYLQKYGQMPGDGDSDLDDLF